MSQSFADKLDFLFRTHLRADGHEHSTRQVAAWIQEERGHAVSPAYIWQLRNGERDNPTKRHLEDLAAFFAVSPQYFFEESETERTQAESALLAALKQQPEVQRLALRSLGISGASLQAIGETIERVRTLEGLDRQHGRGDTRAAGNTGEDPDLAITENTSDGATHD